MREADKVSEPLGELDVKGSPVNGSRMKEKTSVRKALVSLVLPVTIALIFVIARLTATSAFFFEVTQKVSTPGSVQLYYDMGSGFNEAQSIRIPITEHDRDKFRTFRFHLPEGSYHAFRLDPIDREADITLSSARILLESFWGTDNQIIGSIRASQFRAGNQISSFEVQGDRARIVTSPNAKDPALVFRLAKPLSLKLDKHGRPHESDMAPLLIIVVTWFLLWLANKLFTRCRDSIVAGWQRVAHWGNKHHYLAIAGMAILAAVLSSYPVVFFGKSFVSPNHHTKLLYDKYPTLPGYTSSHLEDLKGPDVGAMMWQHLPYSVVQGKAVLHDAEPPLWNRFNSTGTTFLGQGQSMFGDPLHVPVLLAKGASWAWDMKFVAAKMLFALALGLIVHALTRNLAVSLLLTLSSVYVGFFAFRFNHPAIFSMAYSPWILYCWIRFVQIPRHKLSTAVYWLSGLILANWAVMNSGTAKEAYMLLVFLNFTGLLVFLFWKEENSVKLNKGTQLLLAQALFVMISAPIWITFLEALRKSFTVSNVPFAIQIPPALVLGVFDDIFYRQLISGKNILLPSANFLILIGFIWAMVRIKHLMKAPAFPAICLGAVIPFSLAFALIPAKVITAIPFLGNVVHVGNTFSVVLIVHLIILAGFGLQSCLQRLVERKWAIDMGIAVLMLGILLAFYFSWPQKGHKVAIFILFGFSLVLAFVALPPLTRRLLQGTATAEVMLLVALCLVALHWRHGMYLKTGVDQYVMNPQVRVNLEPESPAIEFIKHDSAQPFRAVGLGDNLWAGYNGALGIESIAGADALMNPFYREFTELAGIKMAWDWRLIVEQETLKELKPVYDFLNVRYFLSMPDGPPAASPGLEFAGQFDMDVYRSTTVWPRAFFTDRLRVYKSPAEFVALIRHGDDRPFAAVEDTALAYKPSLQSLTGRQQHSVIPATNYKLTNNTTTFTVAAPSKGVIVLAEAYLKDDFRVTLNGKPVDYFRVNQAFKGVEIEAPGTYTVVFAYWPQYFSLLLAISGVGLLVLLIWLLYPLYRSTRTKASSFTIASQN